VFLRAALALGALLVAVVGFEAAMRALDLFGVNHGPNTLRYRQEALVPTWFAADGSRDLDGTLFRHRPGATTDFGTFRIRTNRLGFRGPEVEPAKPPDVCRIVVLGDSVTLGWGIEDEDTFCRRVERTLNARGDRRYEVINTGHLSYDTMQEAALLEREAIALQPDVVLLVFVTNDVVDPTRVMIEALLDGKTEVPGSAPTLADRVVHTGQRFLPAWTALLQSVTARLRATAPRAGEEHALAPESVPFGSLGWERSQAALRRIRDLCAARGVKFAVLDHTLPPLPVLETFCAAEGIPRHDFRFTAEELGRPIYNSFIDSHANALGNELLAEKALRALATLLP